MGMGRSEARRVLLRALAMFQESSLDGESLASVGEELVELDAAVNRLRHEQAMAAARFDASGGAAVDGLPTTATWLRARTTATHGEAGALVRTGRELRDRLPNTAAALRCGELGWDGARTIAKGLRNVHDPAVLGEADAILAAHAPRLVQHELAYLVRETLQRIDPETAQRDARQRWEDWELTVSPMLDGAVALRGQLDEHGSAVLQSALAPLIKPLGPGDTRTARQRRAAADPGRARRRRAARRPVPTWASRR
jgi:hypothetical protein